ncbi:MAG: IS66 family insertion sequence element accessory protein TnpB [Deltaproteobacteria bacterium]|nr:IS66 family insertion sequence element accessory protein TnpB [Deltaproteobacteria bacterium]
MSNVVSSADLVKILFFDQTGDCIFYKRLDAGTFRGIIDLDPSEEQMEIDAQKLRDLLAGIPGPSPAVRIFTEAE